MQPHKELSLCVCVCVLKTCLICVAGRVRARVPCEQMHGASVRSHGS